MTEFHNQFTGALFRRARRQEAADLTLAKTHVKWDAAVEFLRGYVNETTQQQIRLAIPAAEWPAAYHMGWGMGIRNALRGAGFSENDFGIQNLDNIYVPLVEEAVTLPCQHPEFESTVDVYHGPDPDSDTSRFEATIVIRCARCRCEMQFRDFNGSRVIRVRLDPCPTTSKP